MTDNVAITAGAGTNVATDDIGGVHYPRVKITVGADGVATDAAAGAGAVSTGTQRVTLGSDDPAVASLALVAASASVMGRGAPSTATQRVVLADIASGDYKVVASTAVTTLGATGAVGDYLLSLLVIPGSTAPGSVTIQDGASTSMNTVVFTGGASSVSNLVPFTIPLGLTSISSGWKVTMTGATATTVIASGNFT